MLPSNSTTRIKRRGGCTLSSLLLILVISSLVLLESATSFTVSTRKQSPINSTRKMMVKSEAGESSDSSPTSCTRRSLLQGVFAGTTTAGMIAAVAPPAHGDEADTIWLTGKAPKVPGQKPKDKNDVSGTRRDPKFLRSIADCKNQCENSAGPDGYAKTKEDCLSECQDICCMTYEQCTFAIVPRM